MRMAGLAVSGFMLAFFFLFLWPSPAVLAFPSKAAEEHMGAADDWQSLLRQKKLEQAEGICRRLIQEKAEDKRVEGHKCLANVILFQSRTPQKDDGEAMHGGWTSEGADKAIEEMEKAMKLAPKDLSLHQMRLFVLLRSGQAAKLPRFLQNSLQTYTGPDAFEHWLSFSREFWTLGDYAAGLEYLQVLAEKYPNNPKLLGNLSAFAAQVGTFETALEYARAAVELQPDNPNNQWNLAGIYERMGETGKADAQFQKALPLFKDQESADAAWCAYGMFVENTLKQQERGREIIEKHCKKGGPAQ